MNNEFTLLGPKIDDNKQENIVFILDLHDELNAEVPNR
jgi:hypothetical protein